MWSSTSISVCCFWSVAASSFLLQKLKEHPNCFIFPLEDMLFFLTTFPDPPPSPGKAGLSEHGLLDLHGIIACHVPGRIRPFDIELVGLRYHVDMIVTRCGHVQRLM